MRRLSFERQGFSFVLTVAAISSSSITMTSLSSACSLPSFVRSLDAVTLGVVTLGVAPLGVVALDVVTLGVVTLDTEDEELEEEGGVAGV